MQFEFPKVAWAPEVFDKLLKAIGDAIFKYDFDSNDAKDGIWQEVPSDSVVEHSLGVLPKTVLVYEADDLEGTGMAPATWTVCDDTNITISVSKSFYRVLLNK